ncbi:MAG: adenosylmethionine decarboxylase [Chlamydiae bacterium]|jgi:S-adenosylmethionine decarboxylase|nr:adenosylmethionine decarboxylase [Chlamydiota bacterium]
MLSFRKALVIFLVLGTSFSCQKTPKKEMPAPSEYLFQGNHFFASYCDCDEKALTDNEGVAKALIEACKASGAGVLDSVKCEFAPIKGMSMVVLLSESHASIHTYPEHNACFVDLFTCGDHCHSEPFDKVLREYLKPKRVSTQKFIRNEGVQEIK